MFFDVHGCQMNVSDTEVVWSILKSDGFIKTEVLNDADVVLIMTCAIREGAENKIWNKILNNLKALKKNRQKLKNKPSLKIGILGKLFINCMNVSTLNSIIEQLETPDFTTEMPIKVTSKEKKIY